jgi:hypothetical protein
MKKISKWIYQCEAFNCKRSYKHKHRFITQFKTRVRYVIVNGKTILEVY